MWQQKSDADLARDVRDALFWNPSIANEGITVDAKDGIVTLGGTVPSYAMLRAAAREAERVGGARGVVQHLEVRLPQFHSRADADVASAAATALRWDIEVPDDQVQLSVDNGRVTLEGQVPWHYQSEAAERAVRYLTGVTGVTNNIQVMPTATPGDVRRHIADALRRGAETDANNITVETLGGTVTLRGKVHSWTEREDAMAAAWSAPGVHRVEAYLTVSP